MTTSDTREQRLVALLRQSLAAYFEGRVELGQLVSDVESLIDALAGPADHEWVEELRSYWWQLEFAYAMSVDEQRPLTAEEREAVDAAVAALDAMLIAY